MKLTVHIQDAPFVKTTQRNVGTKEAPIMKPKKANCIHNTITRKGLADQRDVDNALSAIRRKYTIAIWNTGDKAGKEMIYVTHEK
tara:strand:- start:79 stop:333 length:255 start_codon:yes stop_codon:yes gene_type:complete